MQKSIAQQFLEIARKDLNAARLLRENGEFPMAIFALQQSVEKTMKALGLEGAMVSFDELASGQIGHKAYRIFRAGAQQMSKKVQSVLVQLETDPSALDFLPISKKAFQQYHLQLKTQEGKIGNLQSADYAELDATEFAELFKSFEEAAKISLDVPPEDFQKQMIAWFQGVAQNKVKSPINPDEMVAFCSDLDNVKLLLNALDKVVRIEIWAVSILFPLSIITTAHEADSRYPCANCGHHPPEYYRPGLPLVDNLGKLIEWQSKCIDVMAEFI
ncbi:MAG: HEPN domain-containing protein [Saprospiraceae bacterium]|nr:HEPN domain-containing protein [Saprospiraceae bacterium]